VSRNVLTRRRLAAGRTDPSSEAGPVIAMERQRQPTSAISDSAKSASAGGQDEQPSEVKSSTHNRAFAALARQDGERHGQSEKEKRANFDHGRGTTDSASAKPVQQSVSTPSFPRGKRDPGICRLLWSPLSAGTDEIGCPRYLLTATARMGRLQHWQQAGTEGPRLLQSVQQRRDP